jgi:cytochrome b561
MPATRFSTASIILHWTMALAIAAAWILAQVIDLVPRGPGRTAVLGSHALVGLAVLALLLPRLLTRLRGPVPGPVPGASAWETRLATATHVLLYGLMLVQPLTGIAFALVRRAPTEVLGLFTIPNLYADDTLRGTIGGAHELLANLLLATVALHVAATLFHHFIRRDDVAARMIPVLARDDPAPGA